MLREKKRTLILSTLLTLSPILIGLLLWDKLPDQMTTHWGGDGVADGWSSRTFAVFGLPLIMLATHWLCIFVTSRDPRNKNQNKKVFELILWIIPVISLFTCSMVYIPAFDSDFAPGMITFSLLGVVFILIGNYMPKCRQNRYIGIKIKWTLENEENWNATHRMAGRLWVIIGFLCLFCGFLPLDLMPVVMVTLITVTVVVPTLYSWNYHKKHQSSGNYTARSHSTKKPSKAVRTASLIGLTVVLIFVGVLMFTGNIEVQYGEDSFTIDASYWDDLTVEYEVIDSIEYREDLSAGVRAFGFGSARLSLGQFKNDEFGSYTRYTYTGAPAVVVIHAEDKILVLSGRNAAETQTIYETLKAR